MYILHGFLYTETSHRSLLPSPSAKIQKWKLICTGRAVAWEKVHMPQFAEPGMAPLHASPRFQEALWKKADEKVQIRSCWPHRDLGITSWLPCFKHHLAVERDINQKRGITHLEIAKEAHMDLFNVECWGRYSYTVYLGCRVSLKWTWRNMSSI